MAIITVKRTRQNGFMNEINRPLMRRVNDEGRTVDTKSLSGAGIPGTQQGKVIKYDAKKRKFPLTIPKEELDAIVKEMALYDSEGAITECNIRDSRDRFITHPEMKLKFDENAQSFDDEEPKGKIWRNYMEVTGEFKPKSNSKELVGLVEGASEYTYVENKSLERAEEDEQLDELAKATNLLANMDHETRVKVLRAMGRKVEAGASVKGVDRLMAKLLIKEGNIKNKFGKTNIDMFIEAAELPADELNIKDIVKNARDERIIKRVAKGKGFVYKFGEVPMGANFKEVEKFLKDKDNEETLNDIIDAVNS